MGNSDLDFIDFFEKTPDLVFVASKKGFFKKVNPAVLQKLGYTKKELFSRPISSFIHPDDRERTAANRKKLIDGEPLMNFENRYVAKDGNIVWLAWTSIYFLDKKVVFAIAKDVTEKKQIEKEVDEKYSKYKSLATHFKRSMEEDKKFLAAELHEELAQLASVIKFDIDWMKTNIPDLSTTWKTKIEHAFLISELLINTIQRIAFSISPKMLDDLGLDAAIEWYCKEFSILNAIACRFESEYDQAALSQEVKLDFFRICQESLNHILHYANPRNILIRLEREDNKLVLSISDDGTGIKDEQDEYSELTRIRERTASINGDLFIQRKPGFGNMIRVTVKKD